MAMFDRTPKLTGEWECMECGYIEKWVQSSPRASSMLESGTPEKALEFFPYENNDTSADEDWDADDLDADSSKHHAEEDDT